MHSHPFSSFKKYSWVARLCASFKPVQPITKSCLGRSGEGSAPVTLNQKVYQMSQWETKIAVEDMMLSSKAGRREENSRDTSTVGAYISV